MRLSEKIYTVSALNKAVGKLLTQTWSAIWLEGEISNITIPRSKHMYFALNDEAAQIRCVMFRTKNQQLSFSPKNGHLVRALATVSLYQVRGDFQLIIERMQLYGDGLLLQEFIALKQKLLAEGLFDTVNKKNIPIFAKTIGIITSPTGAAIQDIISVIKRRYGATRVIVYPTMVQGDNAAQKIIKMLQLAEQQNICDVLIIARGGGSIEDLHTFNNEKLARQISSCLVPIVTGIGHEIDYTIADFVADKRAATPSAAAEIACPDKEMLYHRSLNAYQRLQKGIVSLLNGLSLKILKLSQSLPNPNHQLRSYQQQFDEIEQRLYDKIQQKIKTSTICFNQKHIRFTATNPKGKLAQYNIRYQNYQQRMQQHLMVQIANYKEQCSNIEQLLSTLSPLSTLKRGYAIVTTNTGNILRNARTVKKNELLHIQLSQGEVSTRVEKIK